MKYIVYKTTNLVNNYIYIGVHKTNTPYIFDGYLGNGVYYNRPNTYKKSKTCFQIAVKQFGVKNFNRETLAVFETAEEAYAVEELIVNETFLARADVYNMIRGGIINQTKGKPVYQYSAITGLFLKEYSSLADAGKDINSDSSTISHSIQLKYKLKNFIFSFEKKSKIELSEFNFKTLTPVYRYLKSGEFDMAFTSLTEAGNNSLDTVAAYIQKAAILGYLVKDTFYFSFYKFDTYNKARLQQIKCRSVYKYSKDGVFIQEYSSQEKAEKENKNCNITQAIKGRIPDQNGNFWSLELLPYFNIPKKHTAKRVGQFDNNGMLIKEWESCNACAKEVGTAVKNVLRGKYYLHKGYTYKYISN